VFDLRDDQRCGDEILPGRLHPSADPFVIVIAAVHKSYHHRGVEHDHPSPKPISAR